MDVLTPFVLVGALLVVRFFTAFRLVPLLGGEPLPVTVCGGLALALSAFFFPMEELEAASRLDGVGMGVGVVRELLVGVLLGVSVRFCFFVLELAGGVAGRFAFRASGRDEPSVLGKLYVWLCVGVYLVSGGHHALFLAVSNSLNQISVVSTSGQAVLSWTAWATHATTLFSGAFAFGVLVAAPIFVAATVAEMLIALSTRFFGAEGGTLLPLVRNGVAQVTVALFLWKSVDLLVHFIQRTISETVPLL